MRIDKYDPISGGFRAPLAADLAATDAGNAVGVGLDVNGRLTVGVSVAAVGIVGLLATTTAKKAGDIVDVMTHGEMVEAVGLTAGTNYTVNTVTGVLSNAAASATQISVGFTIEATRLIVRRGRA